MEKPPFYITTAISYVNGPPHIGHGYEAIATDVIARFHRLDGRDVFFLTGTDEHGQKVADTARGAGMSPPEFCDGIAAQFQEMAGLLGISNDDFIRTTETRHHAASQAIWQAMKAKGDIYLSHYAGWYSVRDEAYFAEDELEEEGGERIAPTGNPVKWMEEPSYFFRLSAYQDRLLKLYEDRPDFIRPQSRRNEVVSFVGRGLRDLSISRTSFDWGVPVPDDPDHVMYVWVDALTNYLTAIGYPDTGGDRFRRFWPCDLHVIGKDIVRFHAVYWPAFLMSAGLEVPRRIFGHGFLNIEGRKMSKSLGNVMAPADLVAEFGRDQTRYFLMREVPFGNDGSVSPEALTHRINGDLANDFGNLAQRSLAMIAKNCGAAIPQPGELNGEDKALMDKADKAIEEARAAMADQAIHDYLAAVWRVVGDANAYFAHAEPWVLRKSDPARMATVLYVTVEAVRNCAILAQPVMPDACARMLDQLGVAPERRVFADLGGDGRLVPGTPLPKPEGIFPRHVIADEVS